MRSSRAPWVLLALACLAGAGCSSHGRLLPEERVADLEPGRTSQQQVREWFGRPDSVEVEEGGGARGRYLRENRPGTQGPVGRWVIGPVVSFFEHHVLFPPPRLPGEGRVRDRFEVSFGPDGRVTDFRYQRSAPSR